MIISASIEKELVQELDELVGSAGFSGRSDALRAAIRMLITENTSLQDTKGNATSLLLVVHGEAAEGAVAKASHKFEDITVTRLHSKPDKGKCLELFVLEGPAGRILEMDKLMKASVKTGYSKLVKI